MALDDNHINQVRWTPAGHDVFADIESTEGSTQELTEPPRLLSYLTSEQIVEYTEQLKTRVAPGTRKYAADREERVNQACNLTSEQYKAALNSAWKLHNDGNKLIDIYLAALMSDPFQTWGADDWKLIGDLLQFISFINDDKGILSGGLKQKIETAAKEVRERYKLTDAESNLALTSANGTFYELYQIEHIRLRLMELQELPEDDINTAKQRIARKFHLGDVGILEARYSGMDDVHGLTEQQIVTRLEDHDARAREIRTKKTYLMIERPDLALLDDLIYLDNCTEYMWGRNLAGFPDVVLRDQVAQRLRAEGILTGDTDPLRIPLDEFVGYCGKMASKMGGTTITPLNRYMQNDNTCGVSCVIPMLEKTGIQPSRELEFELWEKSGKPYNHPGKLAKLLIENGFRVTWAHSPSNLYWPEHADVQPGNNPRGVHLYIDGFYEAKKMGMGVDAKEWDIGDIKKAVRAGGVCIVGVDLGGDCRHWVTVNGVSGPMFKITDPLGGIREMHDMSFRKMTKTTMGRNMLIVYGRPKNLPDKIRKSAFEMAESYAETRNTYLTRPPIHERALLAMQPNI